MKNKTAKEWLQEEELYNGKVISKNLLTNQQDLDIILEHFANYRTADIQATILNFRMKLKAKMDNYNSEGDEHSFILFNLIDEFDEHFEIEELNRT